MHAISSASVVRLTWTPGNPGALTVSDWFTPFLDVDRDGSHKDSDLGSGGVLALPDAASMIVGGKDGIYYHVSRSAMGQRDFTKLVHPPFVACQSVAGGAFFRSVQDCNSSSAGGNSVQMCRQSTGQCCTPGGGNNCQ